MNIFPLLYFPPISYFISWEKNTDKFIEKHENFPKQTLRNRMQVLTANGIKNLSIPINHNQAKKYIDIKISYEENWQKNHWKTLESSYRCSPFFEYYEDSIKELIFNKNIYLFDYNQNILNWLLKTLKFDSNYSLTESYVKNPQENNSSLDFRNDYKASKIIRNNNNPYLQVFSDRFDFQDNLSILDFLFNQGFKFKEFYDINLS